MTISYHNKKFRPVSNSSNSEVSGQTVFYYQQQGDVVYGEYSGGNIELGMLIGKVGPGGVIDMRYQQVNKKGELMTGICRSTPELSPEGKLRLNEQWQWTCGDQSTGNSTIEEF